MTWRTACGLISFILCLSSTFFYIRGMVLGPNRPNRAGWWIWACIGLILLTSNYANGVRDGLWMPAAGALCAIVTAIFSLKYGEPGWTRVDSSCVLGAGISILVWGVTGSALLALICALLADFMGLIPMFSHAYRKPDEEDKPARVLALLAAVFNVIVIQSTALKDLVYPLYFFFADAAILALLISPGARSLVSRAGAKILHLHERLQTRTPT